MAKKLNVERSWVRERCIGKGSFATVSLARNGGAGGAGGGVFAVKSVDVASCSPSQVEALENEIRVLRRLSSPYVVKYLGDDSTWEAPAAAYRNLHLEYLPGGTVADVAKRRRGGADVDEAVVRSYARCLVEALRYIHAKGIVHCDVKGQNVLVGPAAGLAKLADFGSAVEIGSGRREKAAAPPRGSPLWMAPEVIRGEYQGPESDVWSLGCTVIEMITGNWPWEDRGGAADTLCRIGYSDELPQFPTQSSELCRDFLSKCLQRDLKKRWSSDQLLRHPFVSVFPPPPDSLAAFPSPRCVLDWFNSDSDSDTEDCGETVSFSAKERIGKLASGISSDWEGTDGGWVVVREGTESEYPNLMRTEGESSSSEYSDSTGISVAELTSTSGNKECLNSEIQGDNYCQQTSSHRSRVLHRAARGDDDFHVYICSKIILLMTLLITVYYTCSTNCILPCFYHIYKKSLLRTKPLLKNFSAFLTVSSPDPFIFSPDPFIKKEFIVNVDDRQQLNLTFSPSPYAFVNGIEIVSMPSDLYFRGDDNYPISAVQFDNSTTLETLYRFNVGGEHLGPRDDTGMFREWSVDDNYVVDPKYQTPSRAVPVYYTNETPNYTAPDVVYTSARIMDKSNRNGLFWLFPIDAGFYYLFRFYFCEFGLEITAVNQRVFSIEINNKTVEDEVDVIDQSGGHEFPIMKDYVVLVPDPDGRRSKQNVSLFLRPNMKDKPEYINALLNGLEIFKLNDSTGSLAVPNPNEVPEIPATPPEKEGKKGIVAIIGGLVGGVVFLLLTIILIIFLIFRRRKRTAELAPSVTKSSWVTMARDSITTQKTGGSDGSRLPLDLCRHFSLDELKLATGNFNENFVIGRGGFGKVYRGYIDADKTSVAIKRLSPESSQGFREFQTEIKMLSKLRHLHLVSLIGYCDTDREMILIYDYMAHGTLRDHLYSAAGKPPLPWKQRLRICIGAAKGLHYLHAGARHPIIHRDVKSTNILLDEKWVAKLSDFGLSKVGPLGEAVSHVSTAVKGSFGYVDPEYYRRRQVTEKSDVYSFGVVLFEVLCARAAVIPNLPRNKVSLAEWGRRSYETGDVGEIVDPNLKGQIAPECLIQYVEIACNCLKDQGIDRPAMNDVVWGLEFALQLQDAADKRCGLPPPRTPERPSFPLLAKGGGGGDGSSGEAANNSDEDYGDAFTTTEDAAKMFRTKSSATATSTSDDSLRGQSHTIFSELSNQLGR